MAETQAQPHPPLKINTHTSASPPPNSSSHRYDYAAPTRPPLSAHDHSHKLTGHLAASTDDIYPPPPDSDRARAASNYTLRSTSAGPAAVQPFQPGRTLSVAERRSLSPSPRSPTSPNHIVKQEHKVDEPYTQQPTLTDGAPPTEREQMRLMLKESGLRRRQGQNINTQTAQQITGQSSPPHTHIRDIPEEGPAPPPTSLLRSETEPVLSVADSSSPPPPLSSPQQLQNLQSQPVQRPAMSPLAAASIQASPKLSNIDSSSVMSSPRNSSSLTRLLSRASAQSLFSSLTRRGSAFFFGPSAPSTPVNDPEAETKQWLNQRMKSMFEEDELHQPHPLTRSNSIYNNKLTSTLISDTTPLPWYYTVLDTLRFQIFPPFLILLILTQLILLPMRLALSQEFSMLLQDVWIDVFYLLIILHNEYLEIEVINKDPKTEQSSTQSTQQQQPQQPPTASSPLPGQVQPAQATTASVTSTGWKWPLFPVKVKFRSQWSPAQKHIFLIDVLSSLPYSLLISSDTAESLFANPQYATDLRIQSLLHLPRLLRFRRLSAFMHQIELYNLVHSYINPTLLRLLTFAVWMYLVAHMSGCAYVFISFAEGLPLDNEWVLPVHIRNSTSWGPQYCHLIYWGFAAMTGNGSFTPVTTIEHLFSLIVLVIGISIYGLLIGNLTSIIQNLNSKNDEFRTQMTELTELMKNHHLPAELQLRVKSCVTYQFGLHTEMMSTGLKGYGDWVTNRDQQRGKDGWDVLNILPHYLRNEVLCHINGEIIHKVPLFRNCSDGFMRSLVPLLKPEVVIPGDYIIHAGELGREMYLLRRGTLEVIAHGEVIVTLSDGSYVGEVAIIFEGKRTASVRAVTFCDILVLSKEDFDSVVQQYPEVQKTMKMEASMRRNARAMQDKLHQKPPAPAETTNTSTSASAIGTPSGIMHTRASTPTTATATTNGTTAAQPLPVKPKYTHSGSQSGVQTPSALSPPESNPSTPYLHIRSTSLPPRPPAATGGEGAVPQLQRGAMSLPPDINHAEGIHSNDNTHTSIEFNTEKDEQHQQELQEKQENKPEQDSRDDSAHGGSNSVPAAAPSDTASASIPPAPTRISKWKKLRLLTIGGR